MEAIKSFLSNLFSLDSFDSLLGILKDLCLTIINWLYTLFFVDLWQSAKGFGNKLLNYLFSSFNSQPFSIALIEYFAGFILIVFAIKFTLKLVRG